ncbi:MAG TPA: GspH/FimT family pseudopilin [Burkholderiaceae bacterium]|nr:GspH/FimT family pseudopilin [Burkholderiaceae bacterium]
MRRAQLLMCKQGRSRRGFTVIELMITLVIAGILLAIGVPAMRDMVVENRLTANVNEFIAAATFARSEAIKRGRPVTLCRSVKAEAGTDKCITTASGDYDSSDWGSGWIVIVPDEKLVLLRQGALPAKIYAAAKPTSLKSITYNGSGGPVGALAGARLIFSYDGQFDRTVCITRTGRIRVIRDAVTCPS